MGCNCGNKKAPARLKGLTLKSIFNHLNSKNMADAIKIRKENLVSKDKLTLLKFAQCADQENFYKAFNKAGIQTPLDDDDLVTLAIAWEQGKDLDGSFISDNGKPVKFSIKAIYDTININLRSLADCSVKFV